MSAVLRYHFLSVITRPVRAPDSGAVMCPYSFVDSVITLYKSFIYLINFLSIYFLPSLFTSLLIYFFQNRPVPFPGKKSQEATKPGFNLLCSFCVVVYLVTNLEVHVCFCCV